MSQIYIVSILNNHNPDNNGIHSMSKKNLLELIQTDIDIHDQITVRRVK